MTLSVTTDGTQSQRPVASRTGKRPRWSISTSLLFCAPALLLYLGLVVLPTLLSFVYSLTDWSGWTTHPQYIGLENFRQLLHDEKFAAALRFTIFESAFVIFFFTGVALVLAVLLDRVRLLKGIISGMFFYPFTLCLLVAALLFQYLASYREGAINLLLRSAGLNAWAQDWMGNPALVPYFVLALVIWCGLGFALTLYLAGLQAIPQELYEAATLDGAGPVQVFRHIQIPLLMPTIKTNCVLALITGVNLFPQILVTTGGGPGYRTFTAGYYIYWLGSLQDRQGYASAVSFTLFVFLVLVAIVQVRLFQSREVSL